MHLITVNLKTILDKIVWSLSRGYTILSKVYEIIMIENLNVVGSLKVTHKC